MYRVVRRRHRSVRRMHDEPCGYAELHCLSHFSFQRGASSAEELFARAKQLGYAALAITDECSLAGAVRALQASETHQLKLIVGSEFRLDCGLKFVLLCADLGGYAALSRLITTGRRAADKGTYRLQRDDVSAIACDGLLALWMPQARERWDEELDWLHSQFPQRCWIAVERHRCPAREPDPAALAALAHAQRVPQVACGDVHMHQRRRRALQDALSAIRLRRPVAECGLELFPNGERHLRRIEALAELYPRAQLDESLRIAERCRFSLREVKYDHPEELVPPGTTPASHLRALTDAGALARWPDGIAAAHHALIEKELAIIADCRYEAFFLTVHDIVRFAREQQILCQGRGSAANSAVCFCARHHRGRPARSQPAVRALHLEGAQRAARHRRRFRARTARGSDPVHLRQVRPRTRRARRHGDLLSPKSAIRDVGKALGLALDQVEQIATSLAWWDGFSAIAASACASAASIRTQPADAPLLKLVDATQGISAAPVAARRRLRDLRTAAARTGASGKRGDARAHHHPVGQGRPRYLGLLKVDCLALGMLTCIRFEMPSTRDSGKAIERSNSEVRSVIFMRLRRSRVPSPDPPGIPPEDPAHLRDAPGRRYGRRVPDRIARADVDAAAAEAAQFLRSGDRGRDRPPGADPGRHGASLPAPAKGLEPVSYPSEDLRRVLGARSACRCSRSR
jgi:error-prone DNA polymerase